MSGFIPQQNSDTSANGGLLVAATGPISKTQFEDTISSIISGVTGIPRNLVRPRWQPTPPTQPSFDTNWIAFGVTRRSRDANPVIRHFGGLDDGYDELQRQILIDTVVSFYGPDSIDLSELLRDSFRIEQNFYPLLAIDVALNDLEDSVKTAELVNNQWVDRTDITIRFAQREVRTYPIESLIAANGTAQSAEFAGNFSVQNELHSILQLAGISTQFTTGSIYQDWTGTPANGLAIAFTTGNSSGTVYQDGTGTPANELVAFTAGDVSGTAGPSLAGFPIVASPGETIQSDSTGVLLPSAIVYSGTMGSLVVADTSGIVVSSGIGLFLNKIDSTLSGISMGITPGSLNMNNQFQLSDGSPLQLSDGSILTT